MIEIIRLTAEQSVLYFDVVRHDIAALVERSQGEYSVSDYKDSLSNGLFELWIIIEEDAVIGCGVTEIVRYPQYNVCLIRLLKTTKGLEVIQTDVIEKWAKDNNCKRLEMWGRKGWTKVLDKVGWVPSPYTIMNKEIQDE
jgi:hypothetical protein